MIGIDVQAHAAPGLGCGVSRTARAQGFSQHHAHPAVQQAVGLNRARIDWHPRPNEIVANFQEFNAQMADCRVALNVSQQFDGDGAFPDGHGELIGFFVDKVVLRNQNDGPGIGYYVTTIVLDILLGVVAAIIVAWFSRQREFRADAGAADLMGRKQPMINALARLGGLDPGEMPKTMQAMGISARPSGVMALFSSHPPMEERIARLKQAA